MIAAIAPRCDPSASITVQDVFTLSGGAGRACRERCRGQPAGEQTATTRSQHRQGGCQPQHGTQPACGPAAAHAEAELPIPAVIGPGACQLQGKIAARAPRPPNTLSEPSGCGSASCQERRGTDSQKRRNSLSVYGEGRYGDERVAQGPGGAPLRGPPGRSCKLPGGRHAELGGPRSLCELPEPQRNIATTMATIHRQKHGRFDLTVQQREGGQGRGAADCPCYTWGGKHSGPRTKGSV